MVDFATKWSRFIDRLGDSLFHLRGRIDRLSPPSWRVTGADSGDDAAIASRVQWKQLLSVKGVRDMLNERPGVVAGFVALCVVAVTVSVVFARSGGPRVPNVWFYDTGSGQLFAASGHRVAPIPARSGAKLADGEPGGVRAHVYGCGGCSESQRFVAYLERATPEAKRLINGHIPPELADHPDRIEDAINTGFVVASPDMPDDWHPHGSDEAERITGEPYRQCPSNQPLTTCLP